MQLFGHCTPLNCLTCKSQSLIWTPDCQSSFNMLCSRLANTPIGQLPYPNRPYLLFMDANEFCYSDMLTPASTDESNKTLIKLLTDTDSLKNVQSQTQDFQLNSNVVHPVAYISSSFTESQCRWLQLQRNVLVFLCQSTSVPFIHKIQVYYYNWTINLY